MYIKISKSGNRVNQLQQKYCSANTVCPHHFLILLGCTRLSEKPRPSLRRGILLTARKIERLCLRPELTPDHPSSSFQKLSQDQRQQMCHKSLPMQFMYAPTLRIMFWSMQSVSPHQQRLRAPCTLLHSHSIPQLNSMLMPSATALHINILDLHSNGPTFCRNR